MDLLANLLFVAQTAAALWLGLRWSRRLLPDLAPGERTLTVLVLFASIVQVSMLVCGLAGRLSAAGLSGLLAAGVLVELWRARVSGPGPAPGTRCTPWPWPGRVLVAAVTGVSVWAVVGSGTLFGWDTLSYHAVSPAWWLQRGDLSLAPFNYQAYYPMAAGLQALWFMLPHGIDAHANLGSLVWIGVLVSAWIVHATHLGQARWLAALALTGCLLSPQVAGRLAYFSSPDLALASLLTAMLALSWNPGAADRPAGRALLAGLAGGLALGMKVTAAPHLLVVAIWWARRPGGWRLGPAALFAGGALLTGGYWYLRNLLLTGNPIYPAAMGPFAGPFDAGAQASTTLLTFLSSTWSEGPPWSVLYDEFMNWPKALGWLALLGLVVGAAASWRRGDQARRNHLWLLVGSALAFLLLFPLQPFSAGANRPEAPPLFLARYLTYPFLMGLLLLPCLLGARVREGTEARAASRSRKRLGFVAGLGALAVLALSTEWRAEQTTAALYETIPRLGPGWRAMESIPPGSRLAVQSNDPPSHVLIYPLFGRKFQFTPVPVNLDGTRRGLLHENPRRLTTSWWHEFRLPGTERGKIRLRNLRAAGVEYLLLQKWPKGVNVPSSDNLGLLRPVRNLPHEQRLLDDPITKLWRISEPLE